MPSLFNGPRDRETSSLSNVLPTTPQGLPPSFARTPSTTASYAPFPQLSLRSISDQLDVGFPSVAPACPPGVMSHPFASHDVQEADWTRFLYDVQREGKTIQKRRRRARGGEPRVDIVEYWNQVCIAPTSAT